MANAHGKLGFLSWHLYLPIVSQDTLLELEMTKETAP